MVLLGSRATVEHKVQRPHRYWHMYMQDSAADPCFNAHNAAPLDVLAGRCLDLLAGVVLHLLSTHSIGVAKLSRNLGWIMSRKKNGTTLILKSIHFIHVRCEESGAVLQNLGLQHHVSSLVDTVDVAEGCSDGEPDARVIEQKEKNVSLFENRAGPTPHV